MSTRVLNSRPLPPMAQPFVGNRRRFDEVQMRAPVEGPPIGQYNTADFHADETVGRG